MTAPSLRKLRELPPAPEDRPLAAGPAWSFQQGVLTTGIVVAAALAGVGAYLWANEPPAPPEYRAEDRNQRFEEVVETLRPAQAFVLWFQEYSVLAENGLQPMDDSARGAMRDRFHRTRLVRWGLFALAGVVGAGSLLGLLAPSAARSSAGTVSPAGR